MKVLSMRQPGGDGPLSVRHGLCLRNGDKASNGAALKMVCVKAALMCDDAKMKSAFGRNKFIH